MLEVLKVRRTCKFFFEDILKSLNKNIEIKKRKRRKEVENGHCNRDSLNISLGVYFPTIPTTLFCLYISVYVLNVIKNLIFMREIEIEIHVFCLNTTSFFFFF